MNSPSPKDLTMLSGRDFTALIFGRLEIRAEDELYRGRGNRITITTDSGTFRLLPQLIDVNVGTERAF